MSKKPRVFSGIKPSGEMTLGNYLGMLVPAMDSQKGKENIFCVVNYHAITVPQDPQKLAKRTIEIAKMYLAAGLDLKNSTLFVQSDVPEHTELAWILNCFTYFGEANRQVQFKDKYRAKGANVTVGFFDYPVLMAADILLYDAEEVPVGDDQKQHVELCRDIAKRFNAKYGPVFTIPKATIKKEGARIMSLTNPREKMSKSDENPASYILLLDSSQDIEEKFSRAVTDSGSEIKYDREKKPGISNLLNILAVCEEKTIPEIEIEYRDKNYSKLKKDVAATVIKRLKTFQDKYKQINDSEVLKILKKGAQKVKPLAAAKLAKVKKAIGIDYLSKN